jgi:hypothetical protein
MPWSTATLRDLIRPACQKISLDPNEIVGQSVSMKPREALDQLTDRFAFGNNA